MVCVLGFCVYSHYFLITLPILLAHLIAQGFSQVPGINYFDTFAPIAKLASIHAILTISAAEDMEMHQIDIKGAYLNGMLTDCKVIYMQQPPGYHNPFHPKLIDMLSST